MILISVSGSRILCVGAVVTDGHGRLLLIQRGHEPGKGLWSLPGGRVEPGETDAEGLVREMEEETGLTVEPGRLIGQVDRPGRRRRRRALGQSGGYGRSPGDRRIGGSSHRMGGSGGKTFIIVALFRSSPKSAF